MVKDIKRQATGHKPPVSTHKPCCETHATSKYMRQVSGEGWVCSLCERERQCESLKSTHPDWNVRLG